jgi:hypothetical protein
MELLLDLGIFNVYIKHITCLRKEGMIYYSTMYE